jgi:VanZ family protein
MKCPGLKSLVMGAEGGVRGSLSAWAGWVAFCLWAFVLWQMSSRPPGDFPAVDIPHFDKVVHFLYFAGGGAALGLALRGTFGWAGARVFGVAWLVLACFGVLDEWRQRFTPGRQGGDPLDFLADAAGAAVGIAVVLWVYERIARRGA